MAKSKLAFFKERLKFELRRQFRDFRKDNVVQQCVFNTEKLDRFFNEHLGVFLDLKALEMLLVESPDSQESSWWAASEIVREPPSQEELERDYPRTELDDPLGDPPIAILPAYRSKLGSYRRFFVQYRLEIVQAIAKALKESKRRQTGFASLSSDSGLKTIGKTSQPFARRLVLEVIHGCLIQGMGYKGVLQALDDGNDELQYDPLFQKWSKEHGIHCWNDILQNKRLCQTFQKC